MTLREQIEQAAQTRVDFLLAREKAVSEKERELRGREAVLRIAETRITKDPMTEEIVIVVTRQQQVESRRSSLSEMLYDIAHSEAP